MANTDIQPPTSLEAVLSYIAKYVSKPKKSSDLYLEMQAQILSYVNDRAPLLSFVSKMLNKMIAEHDWSVQEVSHPFTAPGPEFLLGHGQSQLPSQRCTV